MCLLIGATGVGKTLLLKREKSGDRTVMKSNCPMSYQQVGTNLTDLTLKKKKVTIRELGGCMGPIWPSYYSDCSSFVVDSANINQVSSSCIQLLSVLSAELLQGASILVVFNKIDIPCPMTIMEMKSLFRLDDIIASALQSVTVLELSARSGQGLQKVLDWLESTERSAVEQHM
uniref:ADP-ribosylation factor-like 16 n=1 Tax=Scleropages formosus TaxID=113540 RepID=A0A8C9T0Z7_SCLFO